MKGGCLKMPQTSKYFAALEISENIAQLQESDKLAVGVHGITYVPVAPSYILEQMCEHCNNYFTKNNVPIYDHNNVLMTAPEGFLRLADDIYKYVQQTEISNTVSSRTGSASDVVAIDYTSWRIMFSQQLGLYRRLRVI